MTVIVTGGAGYIGSHMVLALLDAGERVIVLDNLSTGWRALVPPEAVFVEGDTGDEELVRELVTGYGVDAIMHFAASIYVPKSMTDPIGYYRNNTVNTHALIAAAVATGVKHFIFSSTAAVYGIPDAVPIPEDAPLNPMSPYGASKMMAERVLADVCKAHGMKSCVLRYFNVAGADPKMRAGEFNPASTHLIKVACRTAEGLRDCLDICGNDYATPDGTGVRDYVHVWDLAQAHLSALTYLRGGGEFSNVQLRL